MPLIKSIYNNRRARMYAVLMGNTLRSCAITQFIGFGYDDAMTAMP